MQQPLLDILDQPLNVGDKIAFAATADRTGVMRLGTILEIIEKETEVWSRAINKRVPGPPEYFFKVDWSLGRWKPEKPSRIRADKSKLLRLP